MSTTAANPRFRKRELCISFSGHDANDVMFAWALKERLEYEGAKAHALDHADEDNWKQSWPNAARSHAMILVKGKDRSEAQVIRTTTENGKKVIKVSPEEAMDEVLETIAESLRTGPRFASKEFCFSFSAHVAKEVVFTWQLKERLESEGAKVHALNHGEDNWMQRWANAARSSDLVIVVEGADYYKALFTLAELWALTHTKTGVVKVSPSDEIDQAVVKIAKGLRRGPAQADIWPSDTAADSDEECDADLYEENETYRDYWHRVENYRRHKAWLQELGVPSRGEQILAEWRQ